MINCTLLKSYSVSQVYFRRYSHHWCSTHAPIKELFAMLNWLPHELPAKQVAKFTVTRLSALSRWCIVPYGDSSILDIDPVTPLSPCGTAFWQWFPLPDPEQERLAPRYNCFHRTSECICRRLQSPLRDMQRRLLLAIGLEHFIPTAGRL